VIDVRHRDQRFVRDGLARLDPFVFFENSHGDFVNVIWIKDAMCDAGTKLQAIDQYLRANPNTDPNNRDFLNLKKQLANRLETVAQNATADFGGPWGFEAMAWNVFREKVAVVEPLPHKHVALRGQKVKKNCS
jgi:hypothetical protein